MSAAPASRTTSRAAYAVAALALLAFLAVPLVGISNNAIRLLLTTFLWVTTSLAWNLLGGVTGQVSFGFAVFYGLGAYTAGRSITGGVNPYAAIAAGGAVAAFGSLLIGLPTFRLRGRFCRTSVLINSVAASTFAAAQCQTITIRLLALPRPRH